MIKLYPETLNANILKSSFGTYPVSNSFPKLFLCSIGYFVVIWCSDFEFLWILVLIASLVDFIRVKGAGVLYLGMVKNKFDSFFDRGLWYLPDTFYGIKKILLLANFIAFLNLENTYNNIMRANFKCSFPKMAIFKIQNLSPPTFFDLEVYKLVHIISRYILRDCTT